MATDKTDDTAKAASEQAPAAPTEHGEAMQRHINKSANHSERVRHGGNAGAGEKLR